MRCPKLIVSLITAHAVSVITSRAPDQVIGGDADPYMLRWWLTPWRAYVAIPYEQQTRWQRFVCALRLPNAYLHEFRRSDDDRALHDHPWANVSVLLAGEYTEHAIKAGGIHQRTIRVAGDMAFRGAKSAHRIELHDGTCHTLFVTGFKTRSWGFHCVDKGWIDWRRFTNPADGGATVGAGCDG